MISNIIRVGIVSSVSESRLSIRAIFPDKDNQVSDWLEIIKPPLHYNGYTKIELPKVGQTVICLFLGNGLETGFCIGKVGDM